MKKSIVFAAIALFSSATFANEGASNAATAAETKPAATEQAPVPPSDAGTAQTTGAMAKKSHPHKVKKKPTSEK